MTVRTDLSGLRLALACAMLAVPAPLVRAQALGPVFLLGGIDVENAPARDHSGATLRDLIAEQVSALKDTQRRFADCPAATSTERDRTAAEAEQALQRSPYVDPTTRVAAGASAAPSAVVVGRLRYTGQVVEWMFEARAGNNVLQLWSGWAARSTDAERTAAMDAIAREVAQRLLELACPARWEASGGGANLAVSGWVLDLDSPFQLEGAFPGGEAVFTYTPTAERRGALHVRMAGSGVTGSSAGSYEIKAGENDQYRLEQTHTGCVDGIPHSCRTNTDVITLTPAGRD